MADPAVVHLPDGDFIIAPGGTLVRMPTVGACEGDELHVSDPTGSRTMRYTSGEWVWTDVPPAPPVEQPAAAPVDPSRCACGGPGKPVFIGVQTGWVQVCTVCGKEK